MNPKKNPKEIDRLLNKERCIKKTGQIMLKIISGKQYIRRIEMEHN